MKNYFVILLLYVLSNVGCVFALDAYTVSLRVTDEVGTAVRDANVSMQFVNPHKELKDQWEKGLTNQDGIVTLSAKTWLPVLCYVRKEGWYQSELRIELQEGGKELSATVQLRKIVNPVGMYAKKMSLIMPSLSKSYDFDLAAGDWVEPYGRGKKSMIEFWMETEVLSQSEHKQTLKISFPSKGDGITSIVEEDSWSYSEFKWPYVVSVETFMETEVLDEIRSETKGIVSRADGKKRLLRVNTILDQAGDVISCNYVRIESDLSLYGVLSDKPGFKFTYYFNPKPNDKNLEFDLQRNLFKNLPVGQQARLP